VDFLNVATLQKSKKLTQRRPWTDGEKEAVRLHFASDTKNNKAWEKCHRSFFEGFTIEPQQMEECQRPY